MTYKDYSKVDISFLAHEIKEAHKRLERSYARMREEWRKEVADTLRSEKPLKVRWRKIL